ncbi:hypothetical protein [Pseudomonas zeae]|uniref:hypothetical protein n=1 Tax=Pseudomonas zeae TaxID=2745510 RepID=UPI0039E013DF
MPLMIDATSQVAHLQLLDIHGTAMRSALDLMVTADGDQFDDYAALSEQATEAYQKTQVELVQRLRKLVNVAEALPLIG